MKRPDRRWMPFLVVAAMLLPALLAGCTGTEPSSTTPTATDVSGPAAPTDFVVYLEDCDGSQMIGATLAEWVDPYIQSDFTARSTVAGTYDVFMVMVDCARAIANNSVHEDVRWFRAHVPVYQELDNESSGQNSVVVDAFINNAQIHSQLVGIGASTRLATIDRWEIPLAAGLQGLGWEATGEDFAFSFRFPHAKLDGGSLTLPSSHWYVGPPHVRAAVDADESQAFTTEWDAIALQMEGDTHMNKMFGDNPEWTFAQQARWDGSYRFEFSGGF